ncbi:COG3904 family protein [Paraburkholderia sediminicola]|uniref:COG3904 family protein n=1 Tax=Paraburkholderia sediminicola TaxID=458836 RepID=UPI0038B83288
MKFALKLTAILLAMSFGSSGSAMTFSAPKHSVEDVMTWFSWHGDTTRIYAEGEITESSAQELDSFVRANHIDSGEVLFNSPGGSLLGGIRLGTLIRKLNFDTGIGTYSRGSMVTRGICASACAYAFAGGRGRYYSGGSTKLGVHQFYAEDKDINNQTSQAMSGLIVAYLQKMGVDALAFTASASVGPNDILWLTKEEANELHFANDGTEATTAELKQVEGQTYLKVEQKYTGFSSRFLFTCAGGKMRLMGGLVTNPQDAKQKYDWATKSFFTFDARTIQEMPKRPNEPGLFASDSTLWVTRNLSHDDIAILLASKTMTMWVGADGAVGYTAPADIQVVKAKIRDYVDNCRM